MQYTLFLGVFSAGLTIAGAIAPNGTVTSMSPSATCQAQFDACRGSGDPNEAACAASSASCFGAIATMTSSLSPSATCQAQFDACRGSGDPNEAACAASSAACFGAIPTAAVVTEVVTAFTTVCPGATTFAVNNATYTVKSATTLVITNCPCTITKQPGQSAGLVTPSAGAVGVNSYVPAVATNAVPAASGMPAGMSAGSQAQQTIATGSGSSLGLSHVAGGLSVALALVCML